MKTGVLRTCLLWLMILIIPAQAIAGAVSVSCDTESGDSRAQAEMLADTAHGHHHHSMGSASSEPSAEATHNGCILCATSCHGIGALISRDAEPFALAAPARVEPPGYQVFVGQTPEPPKRPPRTAHL